LSTKGKREREEEEGIGARTLKVRICKPKRGICTGTSAATLLTKEHGFYWTDFCCS